MTQRIRPIAPPVEKLHNTPRSLLKTNAQNVGREIRPLDELTYLEPHDIKLNQGPAILGHYLFKLWQERADKTQDTLTINNLSELSSLMRTNNYETKLYLLALGGIPRQIIYSNSERELCFTTVLLFEIGIIYSEELGAKYESGDLETYGTKALPILKDEPVKYVTIKPNPYWIKALEKQPKGKYNGLGLGSVLITNNTLKELQDRSLMAYKLFAYTASNRPVQRIREANLFTHLGLEDQIKKQGKPRVRKSILSALEELVTMGHITEYSLEDGLYSFTFSDKFVKHPEFLKD